MIKFIHLRDVDNIPYGTLAYEIPPAGPVPVAYAIVSPRDHFCYKAGRNIASQRLRSPNAGRFRFSVGISECKDIREVEETIRDLSTEHLASCGLIL